MKGWLDLLLFYLNVTTIFLGLWLAFWAWRQFSITTFIWIAVTRLGVAANGLINYDLPKVPDVAEAVRRFASAHNISSIDFLYCINATKTSCSLLATISLILLAAAELAHLGPRLTHGFLVPRTLVITYKLRFVFGILAPLMVLAPDILIHFWLHRLL